MPSPVSNSIFVMKSEDNGDNCNTPWASTVPLPCRQFEIDLRDRYIPPHSLQWLRSNCRNCENLYSSHLVVYTLFKKPCKCTLELPLHWIESFAKIYLCFWKDVHNEELFIIAVKVMVLIGRYKDDRSRVYSCGFSANIDITFPFYDII